jgi:hypothetical protein
VKLALIPPYEYLGHMYANKYHLLLPECMQDERYMRVAYELAKNPEHYVILDNGAAEGKLYQTEALFSIADELQCQEIVIPDALGDASDTIQKLHSFMHVAEDQAQQYNYMFVCQGQNIQECLFTIERAGFYANINTIGIPRHLLKTTKDHQIRLRLIQNIVKEFGGRYEIHLLGASALWVKELKIVSACFEDEVRGADTSLPYVYGYHGEWIEDTEVKCVRPDDYFNVKIGLDDAKVKHNVEALIRWVEGAEASLSTV